MYGLLLTLHILICFALVLVILLQSGKGGGLAGGAFGGTAQTVFGGRGATDFLTRATMVLAGCFFVTSIALAMMSSRGAGPGRSLIQEEARRLPAAPPQAPGQQPQQPPGQSPQKAPQTPSSPAPSGGNNPQSPSSPPPGGGR